MLLDLTLLIFMLFVILAGAALFTNAVEWFGHRLGVSEGVTGSIFAAVGTTLPETVIPLVAVLSGLGHAGEEVAVGAILGAPLILSTLAMFVTAAAVLILAARRRRSAQFSFDQSVVSRDLFYFAIVYLLAISAAFLDARPPKLAIAVALVGLYAFYVYQHVHASEGSYTTSEALDRLWFRPRASEPGFLPIVLQLLAALALIIVGARIFVESVSNVSEAMGVPTVILSLFVVPLATELPEKLNSVIWVFKGKDTLALGNISGAMVWQSSIVPTIGIVLTPWSLTSGNAPAFVSAAVALAAAALLGLQMRLEGRLSSAWVLLTGGAGYFGYLAYILATH